jgi:hydrogenase maturation protease
MDRGDDAIGRIVARSLRERVPTGISVVELSGEPTGVIEVLSGARVAIIVDAVRSGGEPGTVHRFELSDKPLPSSFASGASTHGLGVAEAVELARTLERLPARLILYGIESSTYDHASPVSGAVGSSVDEVVALILQELPGLLGERP